MTAPQTYLIISFVFVLLAVIYGLAAWYYSQQEKKQANKQIENLISDSTTNVSSVCPSTMLHVKNNAVYGIGTPPEQRSTICINGSDDWIKNII